jgi:hypothetical protein
MVFIYRASADTPLRSVTSTIDRFAIGSQHAATTGVDPAQSNCGKMSPVTNIPVKCRGCFVFGPAN